MILDDVRASLLLEAQRSPGLLSDLAGLEQYIAESYNSRSFIELLQNADDATSTKFVVERHANMLFVANNGRVFSKTDLEALCRSASSSKDRVTSIGFRGIGFKSVVGFAKTVHLFSGELGLTFSRSLTALEIPEATRVPLVRVPHAIPEAALLRMEPIVAGFRKQGLGTVFVFDDLMADAVEAEFSSFDPTSTLFLRSVQRVELRGAACDVIDTQHEELDSETTKIRMSYSRGNSTWIIVKRDGVALAFGGDADAVRRIEERDAVVHAFLPTQEPTGFPIKVNGDVSTDPSRTRLILDSRTRAFVERTAGLVVDVLERILAGGPFVGGTGVLNALIPFRDPRLVMLEQQSFRTWLIDGIRKAAGERFASIRLRPDWLNEKDFACIAAASGLRVVPHGYAVANELPAFLKFLGAKEACHDEIAVAYGTVDLSMQGAAEIVAFLVRSHVSGRIAIRQVDLGWRLWPIAGRMLSLAEVVRAGQSLDAPFIDLVMEKVGITTELQRLLSAVVGVESAKKLLPPTPASVAPGMTPPAKTEVDNRGTESVSARMPLGLKRWRSAEQQVADLLRARKWQVEDVSRSNLGYDLEGRVPGGSQVYVEVKLIDYPGQPFTLTSNEEAVARQRGDAYFLAIVRATEGYLEVALISNPIGKLALTRQCRQWVWECASYDFAFERIEFSP